MRSFAASTTRSLLPENEMLSPPLDASIEGVASAAGVHCRKRLRGNSAASGQPGVCQPYGGLSTGLSIRWV